MGNKVRARKVRWQAQRSNAGQSDVTCDSEREALGFAIRQALETSITSCVYRLHNGERKLHAVITPGEALRRRREEYI